MHAISPSLCSPSIFDPMTWLLDTIAIYKTNSMLLYYAQNLKKIYVLQLVASIPLLFLNQPVHLG